MKAALQSFLEVVIRAQESFHSAQQSRPFICLTWAQSLDGMIAAAPEARTQISGSESMQVTHALRALHDGILVGVGTILADDPRLSCRASADTRNSVSEAVTSHSLHQGRYSHKGDLSPRAIVLDSRLRTPFSSRFLYQPHCQDIDRRPILYKAKIGHEATPEKQQLLSACCTLEEVPVQTQSYANGHELSLHCHLSSVLEDLYKKNVTSVMVEGGASVISSFLEAGFCDLIVVTVAPTLFRTGLHISDPSKCRGPLPMNQVHKPRWLSFGKDVVLTGTLSTT